MPNARTGKIARAPFELRTKVNEMLRDGCPAKDVIMFLEQHEIRVDEDVVSRWRQGGYQDWLKEQARLDDMRFRREFALQIVKENDGSKIHEATLQIAATQLYETLADFDLMPLKELLKEKPENYPKVVNAIAKLSKGALDVQKYKDLVAEQKKKIEAAINEGKNKGGFSTETIEKIERELKLL
jgi:Lhr-like helicase